VSIAEGPEGNGAALVMPGNQAGFVHVSHGRLGGPSLYVQGAQDEKRRHTQQAQQGEDGGGDYEAGPADHGDELMPEDY
jgi:hypothetical protein